MTDYRDVVLADQEAGMFRWLPHVRERRRGKGGSLTTSSRAAPRSCTYCLAGACARGPTKMAPTCSDGAPYVRACMFAAGLRDQAGRPPELCL